MLVRAISATTFSKSFIAGLLASAQTLLPVDDIDRAELATISPESYALFAVLLPRLRVPPPSRCKGIASWASNQRDRSLAKQSVFSGCLTPMSKGR